MNIRILCIGLMVLVSSAFFGCTRQPAAIEWEIQSEESGEDEKPSETEAPAEDPEETSEAVTEPPDIYVDICGAVCHPGVYELRQGARIYEVIELAGGLLDTADDTLINRAEVIQDGSKIRILTREEAKEQTMSLILAENQYYTGKEASESGNEDTSQSNLSETDSRVNINTADASELETLSGIGPARASDIIAYRNEHGKFSSPEDLMKVNGIKEGTFRKIQDKITIE